ncbi:hypothetical protein [Streptomyces radicis]|uniref:Uncharacterized protein n=1 Tax=Streptomyces radicis TaxID=1750517 RepID=A0A3A9VWQ6_9ACTN|nr:hypothetical protein [Streptomyces radicis]RKN05180.1 hypothetical protein D7319_25735 [Streptomyces radicis]RKN16713.1 hypothetical protein D7318_25100 [Streptomyces radicis]
MPATDSVHRVQATPRTILTGDVLTIGDRHFKVITRTRVHGGIKLGLTSGHLFVMPHRTTLTIWRAHPPGLRPRSFWETALRQPPPTRAEIVAQTAVGCALVITIALAVITR